MIVDPLMATVENVRRYEVVRDDMQTAHLLAHQLARSLRSVFRVVHLPVHGDKRGQSWKANQWRKNVTFLAQVPLFRGLKKGQLRSLARLAISRHYAAGAELVRQGKAGIGLFVVVSGKAEAVRTRRDGTRVVVNTFGSMDFFGEMAVLNNEPRTASVVALEDTECLVLVSWDFLGQLANYREMAAVILQEQSRRFQRAMAVL